MTIMRAIDTTGRCQQAAPLQTNLWTSDYVQDCRLMTFMRAVDMTRRCQQAAAMQTNLQTSDYVQD